jgi:uncharacterized protein YoaH (UPF0181 family)
MPNALFAIGKWLEKTQSGITQTQEKLKSGPSSGQAIATIWIDYQFF